MTFQDKELFKNYLYEYLNIYHNLNNKRKAFHCLNPHHEDSHPSMFFYSEKNICKCFGCGVCYDIFDLIKLDFGYNNFKDQYNKISELFNYKKDFFNDRKIYISNDLTKNYEEYFISCFKNKDSSNYLTFERGISKRLLTKYQIGYDEKKKCIIFPLNKNSYFARSTINQGKYKSQGKSFLFNESLLDQTNEKSIIFITESIIDSLSLETIIPELETISLNGITNCKRLVFLAKEKNFKGVFILCLDNDSAGKNAQFFLKDKLLKNNIRTFSNNLIASFEDASIKDINEAYCKNADMFISNVKYFFYQYESIINKFELQRSDDFEIEL